MIVGKMASKTSVGKLSSVVCLGTYDVSKPRVRILLRGLRENNVNVTECHFDVWGSVKDKTRLRGFFSFITILKNFICAYPYLIFTYLSLPKHDAVLIGYLGLFDILILWPFIKLRRMPLIWDVFIPLYNTVVEDRELLDKCNPLSYILWGMEWLAMTLADRIIIDTKTHGDYLSEAYYCSRAKIGSVLVGVEPDFFQTFHTPISQEGKDESATNVLFYGQFIPLHGIDTIVRAAKLTEKENVQWVLIGKGQEQKRIQQLIDELSVSNLSCIEWVEYAELVTYLCRADIVLGIFGTTDKAQRVIPNKVYQALEAGIPLITADTSAARELLYDCPNIRLIPSGSPGDLAQAILEQDLSKETFAHREQTVLAKIQPIAIGNVLKLQIEDIL